jgi:hypothetical protein
MHTHTHTHTHTHSLSLTHTHRHTHTYPPTPPHTHSLKNERVSSAMLNQYFENDELISAAAHFTNEDLSPADNAAAM